MRSSRASFSIRSDSSGLENLKPCASAGPVDSGTSIMKIAKARVSRIEASIVGTRSHGAQSVLKPWKVSPMRPGNPYGIFDMPDRARPLQFVGDKPAAPSGASRAGDGAALRQGKPHAFPPYAVGQHHCARP